MKHTRLFFSLLLAMAAVAAPAQLLPGPAAAKTRWAVVGDVNGDGLDDVIDDQTVQLNAGGVLLPPQKLGIAGRVLDVLDVNGDGYTDLLVTADKVRTEDGNLHGPFSVWINDGHGNFAAVNVDVAAAPYIADFDGDGKDDLIAWEPHPDRTITLTFLRSNGDGTFENSGTATLTTAGANGFFLSRNMRQHLAAGDVTGDGKRDIILQKQEGIVILPGQGDGSFGTPIEHWVPMQWGGSSNIEVADIDGDGKPDLVWDDARARLHVLFSDGQAHIARTASAAVGIPLGETDDSVRTLALLDATNPKRADVAVGAPGGLVVTMSYSNGTLHETAEAKMIDTGIDRNVNVFAGRFRSNTSRDLFTFAAWGWNAQQSSLLFVADSQPDRVLGRQRAAGNRAAVTVSGATSFRVVTSGPCGSDEIWDLSRDGVFASGQTRSGDRVDAVIETGGAIDFRTLLPGSLVIEGTLNRIEAGHYSGSVSRYAPGCGWVTSHVDATEVQ